MKVEARPTMGAEIYRCVPNVEKKIAIYGGQEVFGWTVMDCGWYIQRQAHVVWRDPEDGKLYDVTPYPCQAGDEYFLTEFRDIDFEPDPLLSFHSVIDCPPTKYESKIDAPLHRKALECLSASDQKLAKRDLAGAKYWTSKANDVARRAGLGHGWAVPDSMDAADLVKAMV